MTAQSQRKGIALRNSTLSQLPESIDRPLYDRRCLVPGLVHIGAGAFNRSHLAVYLDDLLKHADEPRWGELAVGLLPADMEINKGLTAQEDLYSLMQMDTGEESLRVVGSLAGHLYAPEDPDAVLARMTAAECSIISLTVTEGGYFIEDSSGRFLEEHQDIHHDLENPATPRTWLGYVAEAAARRMQMDRGPFTLLSCDNLQGNGKIARKALLAFAGARSGALQRWIEEHVSFPCSMVDRITPRMTDENRIAIAAKFGVEDAVPVVCEPFRQWILEDEFAAPRPAFERVGAQMTTDVASYEKMKMRLLNGGHSTLGYFADLLGLNLIRDAAADPLLRRLLKAYMDEVKPAVPKLPGIDLNEYADTVMRRFANTAIRDQVARICSEGCAKMTKFLAPPLTDLLRSGSSPRVLPLVIAGWLHYQRGIDERGRTMTMADGQVELLKAFIESGCGSAVLALQVPALFANLTADFPAWAATVQRDLEMMRANGVRATIATVLDQSLAG
jgi:mannitol 2-dehydrogenase